MFAQWGIQKGTLFFPKWAREEDEDKRYDETSKMYLLMKKLHQTYESIMLMPTSTRDRLFDMEMEYIKKQKEDIEKNSKIN